MLTVGACIAPPVVALSIFLRAGRGNWLDTTVLAFAGISIPTLRFARGSLTSRALLLVCVACGTSYVMMARIGLTVGLGVSLLTFAILALVCAGRRVAYTLLTFTEGAYLVVGLLASKHLLTFTVADVDPYRLRNWIRMGMNASLLSFFLMAVIDFVIRHVESNARAVSDAFVRLQVAAAEREMQDRDLRIAYQHLGLLHQRLDATKEEERRALSRELHDELGQTLTALKLRLQLDGRAVAPAGEGGTPGVEPVALVDELIARVRKIAVDLRPPLLDEVGLLSALRVYLEGQAALSGLPIDLETAGRETFGRLPADLEIACFRVVQESITNALRHAGARHLAVRIARADGRVSLTIRDDGRGFDPGTLDAAAAQGHLGVVGMRERIRARGGEFTLTSRPGGGTAIEVALDAPAAAPG
jgi:signal transduction histidine kinase